MADPVMVATGHTYDRVCIEKWLAQGHKTCPVTGMRLRHMELTPNYALRTAIQVSLLLCLTFGFQITLQRTLASLASHLCKMRVMCSVG